MKAFVFPGQGSQYCGMAKDIYNAFPQAKAVMDKANDILGYSITDIMFDAPEEELRKTQYTQPAIFLHSIAVAELLGKEDVDMAAGHSLGEYTALCFAGAMSFEDAMKIVARRGELMQHAGTRNPGSMAAIIGMKDDVLDELLKEAGETGIVQAANFNSPGQIVISGEISAVKKAVELAPLKGARMAKELPVSGAFHSPLMKPAEEELKAALDAITIHDAAIPVCMNVTAEPVCKAADIRNNLVLQLTSPVRWTQSVETMIAGGVTLFSEIGPQKVLQGLIKRIDRNVTIQGIDNAEQIQQQLSL
ncbi:[acyl-carrier-protein] S-malonyltransferase [Prosthecochloris sp. ZM]|uniref:ACP S-malonyltransferase n=1 Tax=unclassified Prosthecochloris TaxID=2632826 RepID=UPI000DF7E8EB|nr:MULTISPECIES: ACP S-malonyltransferase [unclassified Prosthecochloris]NEX12563.1 [acyl-carrier-protein] S-malonyltransferase [Prosthecochloris sp.]RDD31111.1 [acyl-carrier-protein] S-malonyltransferase [Prosthecochloris sp. ZM]